MGWQINEMSYQITKHSWYVFENGVCMRLLLVFHVLFDTSRHYFDTFIIDSVYASNTCNFKFGLKNLLQAPRGGILSDLYWGTFEEKKYKSV